MLNMDERLAAALSRLEAILDRSGAAIVPLFHPGIGQTEVLAAFDGIGLRPSAEVVTWFGWHDRAGGPGPNHRSHERVARQDLIVGHRHFPCLRCPTLSIRPQRSLCVDRQQLDVHARRLSLRIQVNGDPNAAGG
jgi:hypothetical protein